MVFKSLRILFYLLGLVTPASEFVTSNFVDCRAHDLRYNGVVIYKYNLKSSACNKETAWKRKYRNQYIENGETTVYMSKRVISSRRMFEVILKFVSRTT